ncbi:MAG: dihydrofolate reductase [Alistipes sp.]|jgi:dipeptidyl-peptidase-3|nr:dihydrofolate reductase [Alistipes sp.]MBQ1957488.1 dihydrofolate reductase [Alistipes sp.]MBQ5623901.1 dihydrofolate reductase [Alistipes sp.]
MKKTRAFLIATIMTLTLSTFHSCREAAQTTQQEQPAEQMPWILDKFDDIKVLRYEVPGFENLPLEQKELIYYLAQATKCGRDILFDQNFKYNLTIRRTLESIYTKYEGDRTTAEFKSLEKYLKKVWFANGIHHHYSNDKFRAEFPRAWFAQQVDKYVDPQELKIEKELLYKIIFDETLYATRLNQKDGVDMVTESACNYYEGVTMKEVDKFYSELIDENDPRPISYGLNSKLMKDDSGKIVEQTWKLGGMYSAAIQQIVFWLEKAAGVAQEPQKSIINALINYYRTGDLREFDRYNILWVGDNVSNVDFVNGFIEDYGDPLGRKASWEGTVNFMDSLACRRTQILSKNAQWFEDNAPIDPAFRKKEVKGVSAKVITVAMLGGDCYPSTPIGINLPNADWIRKEYGSKSVTIDNITYAYDKAAQGNGFNEEFMLRGEDRERIKKYGKLADDLHTDLHECLGHGSGQLAPGTKGGELKNYTSTLEETRADLFGLYYLGDPKMIEIGLIPSLDVAWAQYADYIMNGMMTQFSRIELGKDVEESHMRNRKLIAEWCYEKGKKDNVIEWVKKDGKSYIVVNDFEALRKLFGELLKEVQRIKSKGDYEAGRKLVENYAVKIDPELHKEVLERYNKLGIEPYSGFVNPDYELVMENGKVKDVKLVYKYNYTEQMLDYSKNYSFLPSIN